MMIGGHVVVPLDADDWKDNDRCGPWLAARWAPVSYDTHCLRKLHDATHGTFLIRPLNKQPAHWLSVAHD
jgi:hypothetical protein